MEFPLRKYDLWSVARFESDGGDGGTGDDGVDDADSADSGIGSIGDTGTGTGTGGVGAGGAGDDVGADYGESTASESDADDSGDTSASEAAAGIGGGSDGSSGVDISYALDPGFAAPDDPTNPGISAPTAQQDVAQGSMSPGMGVTDNVGTPDSSTPDFVSQILGFYGRNNSYANAAKGLGNIATALGVPGTTETADQAVAGQEAAAADAGAGDAGIYDFGGPYDPTSGLGGGGGGGGGGGSTAPVVTGEAPYEIQQVGDIPSVLSNYLSAAMNPLQQRTAIATGALNNSDPIWRTQEAQDYYNRLVNNSLRTSEGGYAPYTDITPIEHQYVQQIGAYGPYENTTEGYLNLFPNIGAGSTAGQRLPGLDYSTADLSGLEGTNINMANPYPFY